MKKIFTSQVVYFLALVACVSCLLVVFPGHARATLFSPSVEASAGLPYIPATTQSAPSGPVSVTFSYQTHSGGDWTDYGINRAWSELYGSSPDHLTSGGVLGWSKWTDVLTVTTSEVALGQPISFLFSFGLNGSLAVHEDWWTEASAEVRFRTEHHAIDGIYGVPLRTL